ncbi:MAG: hypothetical protein ACE5JO_00600 [Candidatus Binatia bacterium]
MKIKKNKRRVALIAERLEVQSDPALHESPEAKSRLINQLNAIVLKEKLNALRRQYPGLSNRAIYKHLSDFLNRVSQRERSARRFHD